MKRYGDNLPFFNITEDELSNKHGRNVTVMYGGCGVGFGFFPKRREYSKNHKRLNMLSLLGSKRNKTKEESY